MMNRITGIVLLSCMLTFTSCYYDIKFDRAAWQKDDHLEVNRDRMLNDLMQSYKIRGLSKKEVFELLGNPEGSCAGDSVTACYHIVMNYTDLDLVYSKMLKIRFYHGVAVTCFVEEWTKEQIVPQFSNYH